MKQSIRSAAWAGLLLLLCINVSLAQEPLGSVTVSWTAPTQNEDGTPLTDLAAYKFYYGTASGSYTNQIRVDNPGLTTYVIEGLAPSTYYIVATAINDAGIESRFSNEATKEVLGPTVPEPPINLVVVPGNLVAYGISQTRNVVVAYPIGTVPEGTACNSSMKFNDKYVVPFEEVQWVGTARPEVVFATCGVG